MSVIISFIGQKPPSLSSTLLTGLTNMVNSEVNKGAVLKLPPSLMEGTGLNELQMSLLLLLQYQTHLNGKTKG